MALSRQTEQYSLGDVFTDPRPYFADAIHIGLNITADQGSNAATHSPKSYQPSSRTMKQLMTKRPMKRFSDNNVLFSDESFLRFDLWEQASGSKAIGAKVNAFWGERKSLDLFRVLLFFVVQATSMGILTLGTHG